MSIANISSDPEHHIPRRRKIKAYLAMKGIKQADIARKLGVSKSVVSTIIKGDKTSKRVAAALRAYGVPEKYLR